MGIEIRLFLMIDAFSRFSGMALACSAGLSLALVEQRLPLRLAAVVGPQADVTPGSWRSFRNPPLTPRITRFLIPANNSGSSPRAAKPETRGSFISWLWPSRQACGAASSSGYSGRT